MVAICVRDVAEAADNRFCNRRDVAEAADNRSNNRRDEAAVCAPNDLLAEAAGCGDDDLPILVTLFRLIRLQNHFLPLARYSSAQNLTRRKSSERSSLLKISSTKSLPLSQFFNQKYRQ